MELIGLPTPRPELTSWSTSGGTRITVTVNHLEKGDWKTNFSVTGTISTQWISYPLRPEVSGILVTKISFKEDNMFLKARPLLYCEWMIYKLQYQKFRVHPASFLKAKKESSKAAFGSWSNQSEEYWHRVESNYNTRLFLKLGKLVDAHKSKNNLVEEHHSNVTLRTFVR